MWKTITFQQTFQQLVENLHGGDFNPHFQQACGVEICAKYGVLN